MSAHEMSENLHTSLLALIVLGKERGFLTRGELSDQLPDCEETSGAIDRKLAMLADLGIEVVDRAPAEAPAWLTQDAAPSANEEDVAEEAAAAITQSDGRLTRTTDPMQMYLREVGAIALLTREEEVTIARRIEDALAGNRRAVRPDAREIRQLESQALRKLRKSELTTRLDGFVERERDMNDDQYHRAVDLIHLLYATLVGLMTPGGGEEARELAQSAMQEASEFLGLPPGER